MDLIYADENLIDQGVLQDYSLDMCYGDEDNTFEVKIQKYNPAVAGDNPIGKDFILYIEFTEYGGIVDRIESDTKTGEVTLKGRTWHGVMNGKVIEPPQYKVYRGYAGEANAVLAQMISDAGLGGLFKASSENSGINIPYSEVRYEPMYDCIRRIFSSEKVRAKLYCRFYGSKVVIGAVKAANYAQSEEFDRSQIPYKTGRTFNNINHMVCLGQGEGTRRAVLHLFADEDGNLQPYKRVTNPVQDSDYILDKSQQKVFGKNEIEYLYDFSSAEITENYLPLTQNQAPANWSQIYVNYFKKTKDSNTGEIKYVQLEREKETKMKLLDEMPIDWYTGNSWKKYYYTDDGETWDNVTELSESEGHVEYTPQGGYTTKPWDWDDNYTDYWYPVGTPIPPAEQEWAQLKEYQVPEWKELTSTPIDWMGSYSSYYTRAWNGYEWVYSAVQPFVIDEYEPAKGQTKKPDDWNDNWRNYYTYIAADTQVEVGTKDKGSGTSIISAFIGAGFFCSTEFAVDMHYAGYTVKKGVLKWKKNKFYTKVSKNYAPNFPGSVWQQVMVRGVAPFIPNYYYKRYLDLTPQWKTANPNANPPFFGYWEKIENVEVIPEYKPNAYYYMVVDRYKILLENALKKFDELTDTSTLEIDLELEDNYDVGDIVGATDELTGEPINKPILRKIIKIKKDIVTVEYQVE